MIHIQSTFSTNVATFHQIRINGQKIKLILNHSDRKLHQITLDFYPITVSSSLFHKGIIPLPFIDNETASLQLPCKKANKLNSDTFSSCLSYVYLCIYISYFKLHFLFFSIHHIIFHSNFFLMFTFWARSYQLLRYCFCCLSIFWAILHICIKKTKQMTLTYKYNGLDQSTSACK